MRDVVRGTAGVVLLLGLAGCGGSSAGGAGAADDAGASPAPAASSAAPGPQAVAAVTAPSAAASAAGAAASAAAAAGTTGGSTGNGAASSPRPGVTPTPTHIILDATLSSTCITPGGSMTLTIRHARPGMQVIMDTTYADGKDGKVYGGIDSKGTRTTTDGGYTFTWTVAPTAPQGDASVQVGAVDSMGYGDRKLTLKVAASC